MKTLNTFDENIAICFKAVKKLHKYDKKYEVKIDFEQVISKFAFIELKIKNKINKPFVHNVGHICLDGDKVELYMVAKSNIEKLIYHPEVKEEAFYEKDLKKFVNEFIKRIH